MDDCTCPSSMLSEFCYPLPQFYTFSVLGILTLLLLPKCWMLGYSKLGDIKITFPYKGRMGRAKSWGGVRWPSFVTFDVCYIEF